MSDPNHRNQGLATLRHYLEALKGRRLTTALAGLGTGSHLLIEFATPEVDVAPDHVISAMVYCGWRVTSGSGVLCGSIDDNRPGGAMLKGLAQIVNRTVESCTVCEDTLDLHLLLSDGIEFEVRPTISMNSPYSQSNYFFLTSHRLALNAESSGVPLVRVGRSSE